MGNKTTIAIIANDISKSAGTERAVVNLANLMAGEKGDTDYIVKIISIFTSGGNAYYELREGVEIIHLGIIHFKSTAGSVLHYMKLPGILRQVALAHDIRVMIGTTHAINSLLPFVRRGRGSSIRMIGCEHLAFSAATGLSAALRKLAYEHLDKVVVLTKRDARHYKNALVIPNTISFYPDQPAALEKKQILAVGRLFPQKGFDMLIEAASIFLADKKDWKLLIFGNGEQKEMLEGLIAGYNLQGRVEIHPPTRSIMEQFLDAAIYVMSSRYEGLPMVLLEARACGLPCISFDCPEGPAEIIHHQQDGLLVENGNIKALAADVVLLMEDVAYRKRLGAAAREDAVNYSEARVFTMWDELIKTLHR